MVRVLPAPAPGVLALHVADGVADGDVTVALDAIRASVAGGEALRLVAEVASGFPQLDPRGLLAEARAAWPTDADHPRGWHRIALVTDVAWIVSAVSLMGWMAPAPVRAFAPAERDEAVAWVGRG